MTTTTEHVIDLPLSAASEELTGYEVLKIQARFKRDMGDLGSIELLLGTVWAYECRRQEKIIPWSDVEGMTLRAMSDYFADEPEDEPGADELGKDVSVTST